MPKHGLLLLAGLWLVVPMASSSAPAGAQNQPENAVHQKTDAGGANGISGAYLHLAEVIVLKNELRTTPGSDDEPHQVGAPMLQATTKNNPEFVAFAKLVRATSKRKFTMEEMRQLYLSFKAWSRRRSMPDQVAQ